MEVNINARVDTNIFTKKRKLTAIIIIDTRLAGCGLLGGADIPGLVSGQWTLFVSAISPPWGKNERLRQIAVNCLARKTKKRTSLVFEYMVPTICTPNYS